MKTMNKTLYHVHIDSRPRLWNLDIRELWRYRDLAVLFMKRDFSLTYKQTILGPLWLFINPLFTCFTYVVIFDRVAGIGTDGIPSILFYLVGNTAWSFLASVMNRTAGTFSANAYVFGKVYFPRLIVPVSYVLDGVVEMGLKFIMILAFCLYFSVREGLLVPFPRWLLLPAALIWFSAMGLGLGLMISSLTVKYRDLNILVSFGMRIWMYGTPVVYPMSALGNGIIKTFIRYNPATQPMELFRCFVLGTGTLENGPVIFSLLFSLGVLFLGIVLFSRAEKNFMDTV